MPAEIFAGRPKVHSPRRLAETKRRFLSKVSQITKAARLQRESICVCRCRPSPPKPQGRRTYKEYLERRRCNRSLRNWPDAESSLTPAHRKSRGRENASAKK